MIFSRWHKHIRCSSNYITSRKRYVTSHHHGMFVITVMWHWKIYCFSFFIFSKID